MNIGMLRSLQIIVLVFFGQIPRSAIAESKCIILLSFNVPHLMSTQMIGINCDCDKPTSKERKASSAEVEVDT